MSTPGSSAVTPILAGIETEYGIAIRGAPTFDPADASRLLLARCQPATPARVTPPESGPSDLMLPNGARFYLDHAHPEYSTPECSSPEDLVAADRAGERILDRCRALVEHDAVLPGGQRLALYKNNSDGSGHSYGCHENYLVSPSTWRTVTHGAPGMASFVPFLITRSILCGAGKVGSENCTTPVGFQLCQRADFFETLRGPQTTFRRPLLNLRDEAHARDYLRLHVIVGDSNLAESSTWLKIGTTVLVLALIEAGRAPAAFRLCDPLAAFHAVSRDLTFREPLDLDSGERATALEIQRNFLAAAGALVDDRPSLATYRAVVDAWGDALASLETDWTLLSGRFDWAIKRALLERILARHAATWEEVRAWQPVIEGTIELPRPVEPAADDPDARLDAAIGEPRAARARAELRDQGLRWCDYWRRRDLHFALRRVDLDYHEIRGAGSGAALFSRLEQADGVERIVEERAIAARIETPPPDTRAWLRGRLIQVLAPHLVTVDWSAVVARIPGEASSLRIDLSDPFTGRGSEADELLASLGKRIGQRCAHGDAPCQGDNV